jgi:hypothetical protein
MICLPWTIFACSPGVPAQDPTVDAPAREPGTATAAPVMETPTTIAPADSDLSEAEILQIVRTSLAAFPWRMDQSVLVKESGQTITTLTEAQSSTRGYNRSMETLGGEAITTESILIDSQVYLKMTGSPAETYGLVSGQWTEVPPDSPLSQFVDRGAIDPARVAEIFAADFASMPKESGAGELLFTAAGSEEVDGVPTTVYEAKGAGFTYRWWIGADQRFYKTTVDLPQATRTILMDYDPGIDIQPPIP